jgi:DNA-binding MarR family transcriptional regulator
LLSHEDQIVAAIRQIIRAVDLHSRRLVNGHGMTGPQLAVLKESARLGPTSPTSLAKAVHLSQATVTGILQRLERRFLIERQPSRDDRRSVLISITPKGVELLESSPSLLQDRFRDALSSLSEWERLQILATLQRVAELMDANEIDASPHLIPGDFPSPSDSPSPDEFTRPSDQASTDPPDQVDPAV